MLNFLQSINSFRATVVSICTAFYGTYLSVITVDVALQRLAWTVAILAGLVAIINGVKNWIFPKNKKE